MIFFPEQLTLQNYVEAQVAPNACQDEGVLKSHRPTLVFVAIATNNTIYFLLRYLF